MSEETSVWVLQVFGVDDDLFCGFVECRRVVRGRAVASEERAHHIDGVDPESLHARELWHVVGNAAVFGSRDRLEVFVLSACRLEVAVLARSSVELEYTVADRGRVVGVHRLALVDVPVGVVFFAVLEDFDRIARSV